MWATLPARAVDVSGALSRPAKRDRIVVVFVTFPQVGIAYYWPVLYRIRYRNYRGAAEASKNEPLRH